MQRRGKNLRTKKKSMQKFSFLRGARVDFICVFWLFDSENIFYGWGSAPETYDTPSIFIPSFRKCYNELKFSPPNAVLDAPPKMRFSIRKTAKQLFGCVLWDHQCYSLKSVNLWMIYWLKTKSWTFKITVLWFLQVWMWIKFRFW